MSSTNPEKYRFFIAEDCDKANSIFAIGCCFYGNTGGTPGNFHNGSGERRRNFFPADSGGALFSLPFSKIRRSPLPPPGMCVILCPETNRTGKT